MPMTVSHQRLLRYRDIVNRCFPKTLRSRIVLMYVLLVAASFSCVIYLIMNDVRPRYLEAVEETMVDVAELFAASLSQHITADGLHVDAVAATMTALAQRRFSANIYNITKHSVALRVYITDHRGLVLYDSSGEAKPGTDFSRWRDVALTLRGQYGARSTKTTPGDPASRVIYVAAPIVRDGKLFGVVSVGKPTNSVSFLIAIAQKRFLLSLALVGLSAVAFAVVLSAWVTRPVKKLTAYIHAIRRGEAGTLPALGSSEIGLLGAALQEMQTKLDGKTYIEDYVRALTHEMKSPLTGIKGAGEILRDHVADAQGIKFLNNIDSEVGRLHSLVERTLQLSRLENVRAVSKTTFPAPAFLHTLADSFHTQLAQKNIRLDIQVPDTLTLEGDALLLRQALGNLIANAADFSPPGSVISLTASRLDSSVRITVTDQGTGIPDFALVKIFDKFFSLARPDTGKKSTGLGLPFVKEVLTLHNGSITLHNTNPGLEARVSLPG